MRITPFRCAIALTLFFAIPATTATAQNLVRGTVKDSKDKPVEGAVVLFEGTEFVAKRDVKTDKKGEYLFQGLTSGPYKVTASKKDVGTHTRNYTVGAQSAQEKLDFFLVPEQPAVSATPAATAAPRAAPGPPGLESLGTDAAAVAKGKELAALQATAKAAVDAQNAGQHQDAVAKFNEVIGKVPECADCYVRLGASLYELKQHDDALAAFSKSIALRPSVEAYTSLAKIYNSQRKFDQASEATGLAADLAAKLTGAPAPGAGGTASADTTGATSETLYNRGVVLWNTGKYPEAKVQFEAAVKANPNNADAQYQLGMANVNLGELPAARAAFEAYLKAAPDGPKAAEVKKFIAQLPK